MQRILLFSFVCLSVVGALGCGDDDIPSRDGDTRDTYVPPVGTSCDDNDDCDEDEYCSTTSRCIEDTFCLGPRDCDSGRCGAGSRRCLDGEDACFDDRDCPSGQQCGADLRCEIGTDCGGREFGTTRLAPNMLIVLDRSGSMSGRIDGVTRWDVAKEAIEEVTTRFDASVRFGLATYSACLSGGCSAGSVVVPIADENAPAINAFLRPLIGDGSRDGSSPRYLCDSGVPETTTGKTLLSFVGEASLQDATRANTILLVTDGEESGSCTEGGAQDGPSGAAALFSQATSVRTYVVGFSRDVDAGELNAVSEAGGTGTYFAADDAATLVDALSRIAADVATCEYRLDEAPPNEDELYVYFNDDPSGVANEAMNGWTYDAGSMTLTFHGEACRAITAGEVDDIDVVFGCEGPVLE